jgi:hypothetical protein
MRRVAFIEVCMSGARSATGEIGTIRAIRAAMSAGSRPGAPMRATRCPPAECPARRIGPVTRAAIAGSAAATARVISAMRTSGQSG